MLYGANFVFVFKTNVPNDLIAINPQHLAIAHFGHDTRYMRGTLSPAFQQPM